MEKIIQTAGKMQLGDFAPEFAHYNDDVLFGENWNNQDIDLKTRCIVTMVALMSSGITDFSTMPATTESTLFYLSFYKFINFH